MLEIESAVFPSLNQWIAVVHGMRNAYNSWDKIDSKNTGDVFDLGNNDMNLARNLCKGDDSSHAKFLRQLPVIMDIKAPLYWWKQMDQYKVGTVTNSCSTMHKLTDKIFVLSDFSIEHVKEIDEEDAQNNLIHVEYDEIGHWWYPGLWGNEVDEIKFEEFIHEQLIGLLNALRRAYLDTKNKKYWYALNELLPQSYNQKRTWSANYEVLRTICRQRKGHPLAEWETFIEWVRNNVPYAEELILKNTGN